MKIFDQQRNFIDVVIGQLDRMFIEEVLSLLCAE